MALPPKTINAEDVNAKHLEKLLGYQTGFLPFPDQASPGPFPNAGGFLPFQVDRQYYTERLSAEDQATRLSAEELLIRHASKPIEISHVVFDKPIAIIYNPNQKNVRKKILKKLKQHSIGAEFFDTQYALHAWDLAEKELDLTQYSAIAVVGGDGLFHEVVNGLMKRPSSSIINTINKLPVAFLPNGTGNDTVANFGVTSLDQALEFLVKGETLQMDCNLLTMDAKSASEVPKEEWRDRARYSVGSSAVGFIAHVNKKASSLKRYIGGLAYSITGLKELLFNFEPIPKYDFEMEQPSGAKIRLSDEETLLFFINNGKYAGGHSLYTPGALLNDGLLDIVYKKGSFSFLAALHMLDQVARQKGNHVFRRDAPYYRAKSIVVTVKDAKKEGPQLLQIDGENLEFQKFVKIEAVPAALDIIVDSHQVLSPAVNW